METVVKLKLVRLCGKCGGIMVSMLHPRLGGTQAGTIVLYSCQSCWGIWMGVSNLLWKPNKILVITHDEIAFHSMGSYNTLVTFCSHFMPFENQIKLWQLWAAWPMKTLPYLVELPALKKPHFKKIHNYIYTVCMHVLPKRVLFPN